MVSEKKVNELITKALDSSSIDPEGSLQADQANEFIDKTVESTKFIDMINTRRVNNPAGEISKIAMNEPVTYGATEGTAPSSNEASPAFTQISYSTTKLISWMDITSEVGEENITGSWEAFKQQLMAAWKKRIATDHEKLSIQGNASIDAGGTAPNNGYTRLLTNADGILIQLLDNVPSSQVIDWNGEPFSTDIFGEAISTLPPQYAPDRTNWDFFSSFKLEQKLRQYWEDRGTPLGDKTASESGNLTPRGIEMQVVPHWPDHNYFTFDDYDNNGSAATDTTYLVLASPSNFDYVISRDLENYMKFQPRRDAYEGTFFSRVDFLLEDKDAAVVVKNIDVS